MPAARAASASAAPSVRIAATYSRVLHQREPLDAVEQLRAVVVGLVHERRDGPHLELVGGRGHEQLLQRVDVLVLGIEPRSHSDSGSTTGMRSWIGCSSSLASVVMIVNVRMRGASSPIFGSCQISHSPANASGSPSRRRMNHGCFCFLPCELLPLVEAVGRDDRRRFTNARLYAGFVATVSARALIWRSPIDEVLRPRRHEPPAHQVEHPLRPGSRRRAAPRPSGRDVVVGLVASGVTAPHRREPIDEDRRRGHRDVSAAHGLGTLRP